MSVTIVSTDTPEVVAQAMGKPAESKEAPESKEAVTGEVEAATEDESKEVEAKADSEESAESDETEEETEQIEKPKKKTGFAKKLERKDAEIEFLRSQLAKEKPATETPKETKAEGEPDPDKFETYREYTKALLKWELAEEKKADEVKTAQAKAQEELKAKAQTFKGRLDDFADKHEDFYDVVEAVDEYQLAPAAQEFLLESELAAEVMYKLAQNPKEVARIHKLSPSRQVAELGIFEAKLSAEKESKKETKKITSASKPLTPVGSKGKAVEKSIYTPGLSFKEYEALRTKELAKQK